MMKKFFKGFIVMTAAAVTLLCGCSKEKEETEDAKGGASSSDVTAAPEEAVPQLAFSEKPSYRINENRSTVSSDALAANVIGNENEGDENIYFRSADGRGEPTVLQTDEEFLGWKMDSLLCYDRNGAFQARFSCEPKIFEGKLIIRTNEARNELEAAFIPSDLSQFPKADSDGRTVWFAANDFEGALEMLGIAPDQPFISEAVYKVRLTTDRININNLPLEDVRNLINIIDLEVVDSALGSN